MKNVLLGSIGSLAKNTFKSINMLSTGAHWKGGLTYGVGEKYTDEYAGTMMSDTNFFGGLIEQAVNNITGVQQGFTFNILNTKDFGAKEGTGLLELTLGGDTAVMRIGTGGLNVSVSGITDMLQAGDKRDALKSAKDEYFQAEQEYKAAVASGNEDAIAAAEKRKEKADEHMTVYMQANLAQGQINELEEKIAKETNPEKKKEYQEQLAKAKKEYAALDQALITGNYSSIVQFAAGTDQRKGNTAYLGNDSIVDFSFDKNGMITFDMNKMAVSTTKLFHELGGHDGENIFADLKAKGYSDAQIQQMIQNDLTLATKWEEEKNEDKRAHTFDTIIWGGLKKMFGVTDGEMDEKLAAYNNKELDFGEFLANVYVLGLEMDKTNTIDSKYAYYARHQNTLNDSQQAFYTLMKGFKESGNLKEYELLFKKTTIILQAQTLIENSLKNGYKLKRDKDGSIVGTEICINNQKEMMQEILKSDAKYKPFEEIFNVDEFPNKSHYMLMTSLTKDKDNALLMQQFVYDKDTNKAIDWLSKRGIISGLSNKELTNKIASIKDTLDAPRQKITALLDTALKRWADTVAQDVREGQKPKEKIKYAGEDNVFKFGPPYCNIGVSNFLRLYGYEQYNNKTDYFTRRDDDGEVIENVFWALGDGKVVGANGFIDALQDDPNFTSVNKLVNWDKLKGMSGDAVEQAFLTIFNILNESGLFVMGTMKNLNSSGHVYAMLYGRSYDINFFKSSDDKGKNLLYKDGVTIETSLGGQGRTDEIFLNAAKYGTFDFRDQWIEDQMKKDSLTKEEAVKKYGAEFGSLLDKDKDTYHDYTFDFLISNYSIYMTYDFNTLWGCESIPWMK